MFQHTVNKSAFVACAIALSLAGCADSFWTSTPYPSDYRERHPIELADEPTRLEVFPSRSAGLSPRQSADVIAFAHAFRARTKSVLSIQVPVAPSADPSQQPTSDPIVRATVHDLKRTLSSAGVGSRSIHISQYPGHYSEAPIILSFVALTARVPNKCGQWPYDLAAGAGTQDWQNQTYWNFGCASQHNLAAQVADPLDLLRPQQSGPSDTVRSVADVNALRGAKDPSTTYRDISTVQEQVAQ
ncbi:CpaD family pilus assembly protein [Xanthobacter sp. V13C-7B]|uniref:CpaD family pilus assembly protein n=1 Tax=Xanthobacter variabilis TaxID=3119932 RepID=UPI00372A4D8B